MNLVAYTATALSRNDIADTPTNKNIVDGAIVELKDLDGNLVVIYDDAAGANPETQKSCDTNGQLTFWAEVGDYSLEVNGSISFITIGASVKFTRQSRQAIEAVYKAQGYNDVFFFEYGFTYASAKDIGIYEDGTAWTYADVSALPVTIAAGTVPSEGVYRSAKFTINEFDTVEDMESATYLSTLAEDTNVTWDGYYVKGDGGGNSGLLKFGEHTPDGGSVFSVNANTYIKAKLNNNTSNVLKFGLSSSKGKEINKSAIVNALAASDVVYVPLIKDAEVFVGSGISIKNGKRIVFDSEYAGEPLLADPDRGFKGDGLAPIFTTGEYPALANTNRQCRMENARLRNENFPCLEVIHSDDFYLDHCFMMATNANALKGRFSARVEINGGHYLTTWTERNTETNFAITFYDNCNGLVISPSTVISGGANGGGLDVTQSQKIEVDGIYEVCGGFGQRIGGFAGDPNALWQPDTFYPRGSEIKYTTNGWVSKLDHTSGSVFNSANWKVINGNCNGVKFGGYMEQVQKPFSVGANNYCLGVEQGVTYVGNSALPANGVPEPDYCIELGLVVGLSTSGVSYHKQGSEPTFVFSQSSAGGVFGDFLQDSTIENHHVQGGGVDFLNNLMFPDNVGQIFGKNKIKLSRGGVTSGERQTYISNMIDASLGTGQDAFILNTRNGGVIDNIEIIEKSGDITSTLRVGSLSSTAESALINPEALIYTGNSASVNVLSNLIRPETQMQIRVVGGTGIGSFRVKIDYRN